MGMYDDYEPAPPIACPSCARLLEGWQGKDGPCLLLRWRQREAEPAMPTGLLGTELVEPPTSRLPDLFGIYTDCRCGRRFDATCTAVDGVWTVTTLGRTEIAVPEVAFPDEVGRRRCTRCGNVWVCDPTVVLVACPGCERATRLVQK